MKAEKGSGVFDCVTLQSYALFSQPRKMQNEKGV